MPSIDIGANLCHDSFDSDRSEVLARARDAGVEAIIVTGSCATSTPAAIALAQQHPGYLYATAGIHPHHASEVDDLTLKELSKWGAAPEVVALGEMGLDFFRDIAPRPVQERAFTEQLAIAAAIGKPLFLHQRDAHERFLPILKEQLAAFPAVVVHCFTGSEEELLDYVELGLYVGITGWICDERRGHHLLDIVHHIPQDRLMVETDAPYLLPRSIRPKPASRRNEPMHLPHVIRAIAEATRRDEAEVAASTARNARVFFGLRPAPVKDQAATMAGN